MDSLWLNENNKKNEFSKLSENKECDVCVIGAGIFGLTCAYYLSELGFKVIVLEKDDIGEKVSGHTTAKITSCHGLFYNYLLQNYSEKFAKDYLDINEKAIKNIKKIIDLEKINCDFEFQNNYVYTTKKTELEEIKNEVRVIEKLGSIPNCEFVTKTGLPFEIQGAICFKNQAQFHPIKYMQGLCNCVIKKGGEIYTHSAVLNIEKDKKGNYESITDEKGVKSKNIIVATHFPFLNFPGFYFAKMYQSTSYVVAIDTKSKIYDGMYITSGKPIFSYRKAKYKEKEILLVGGSDHKTGEKHSEKDTYEILEKEIRKYYPESEILYKWNTRDCISLDKIPYIGEYSSFLPNVYVGTGFKKWGMTLSNVAANIIVDKINKKKNQYEYLFKASRLEPIKNIGEMKNMTVQSAKSLIIEKLKKAKVNFEKIKNNEGGIIEINNEKIGVYRDINGEIYVVKPICTHLGCLLSWNEIDKTWDCPCHGSRFDYRGKNLYDPAFKDLERYDLEKF